MLSKNDVTRIYETVLSMPGMNEQVKVNIRTSRTNILLLSKAIEKGLQERDDGGNTVGLLDIVLKEKLKELEDLASDLLNKAGLTTMNEKLKSF